MQQAPRRRRRTNLGGIAFVAAASLALAGCSNGQSDDFGGRGDFSVEGAVAQLPASMLSEAGEIYAADLAAAASALGVPGPDDAPDEWLSSLHSVDTLQRAFVPELQIFQRPVFVDAAAIDEELGWSPMEVRQFVQYVQPPLDFAVVDIEPDLAEVAGLTDLGDGIFSAGDADDYTNNPAEATRARPTGVPLRMGQRDATTGYTPNTPLLREWLEGESPTLAENDTLQPLAAALDGEGVLTAMLAWAPTFEFDEALSHISSTVDLDSFRNQVDDLLPDDPFSSVGIGWRDHDGTSQFTLAYLFDSDEAAESALPVFERQWAEGQSLTSGWAFHQIFSLTQARSEGRVAVLTLELGDAADMEGSMFGTWLVAAYAQRDLIFLHK